MVEKLTRDEIKEYRQKPQVIELEQEIRKTIDRNARKMPKDAFADFRMMCFGRPGLN